MTRRDVPEHFLGDTCDGGHYATPGSDGSCCQAAQDTDGASHAWNCQARHRQSAGGESTAGR